MFHTINDFNMHAYLPGCLSYFKYFNFKSDSLASTTFPASTDTGTANMGGGGGNVSTTTPSLTTTVCLRSV